MNKILFFLSVYLIFFSACKRCETKGEPEHYELIEPTQEDISWIIYNNGDTLLFKNNLNEFDTMVVRKTDEFYTGLYGDGLFNSCEDYKIPAYKFENFIDTFKLFGGPTLFSSNSNSDSSAKIRWLGFVGNNDDMKLSGPTFNSITINGNLYDNVFIHTVDTSMLLNGTIWKVYYQKENGLLGFDQLGGIKWERIN